MVRHVALHDPTLARAALEGLRVYGKAMRPARPVRTVVARQGRAQLLGTTVSGAPLLLVPSLINPSHVLDLDAERSLLAWLGTNGHAAMLLDWGVPELSERDLTIAGHVEGYLVPLLEQLGEPVHLVGYCLGGTMAIAASRILPVRSLTLMATPWHFGRYPADARASLARLWKRQEAQVQTMGLMPMEMLQTAFWGLDPDRTVSKFAALAGRSIDDPVVTGFAALEDWANDGAPLTAAAGEDLFCRLMHDDQTGAGQWLVAGKAIRPEDIAVPVRHFVAHNDRIAPAETAPDGIDAVPCPSGHVGMITGSRAQLGCWEPLAEWLRSVDQAQSRS
ncbi:alpha/beta hydrolase [Sphingomonas lacunae]|uniref:Alpha/beta hydrolase n=1 Tax=Sphingomonas lacunae TaxID=2698828 RepID=A0A6M4AXK7_9SPHN|nr:alpha/beta hydrolase [Sphingomonas lacunae]QJQ33100.1 alpha/beta hydrolase [Sphingomonas lacunae]